MNIRRAAVRGLSAPCLCAVLSAAVWTCAATAGPTEGGGGAGAPGTGEAGMLALMNEERARQGIAPLAWSGELARVAMSHAADMRIAGRASPRSRDGSTLEDRLVDSGIRIKAAAENVAQAGDVVTAHRGLMDSKGHRANILDPRFGHVGIGLVSDGTREGVYVVQNFAVILPELSDAGGEARVREAIRSAAGGGPGEIPALSERLRREVELLAAKDSIDVDHIHLDGGGWIGAWTGSEPGEVPRGARARLKGSGGFGLGCVFRKSGSYPLGTWWVILAVVNG